AERSSPLKWTVFFTAWPDQKDHREGAGLGNHFPSPASYISMLLIKLFNFIKKSACVPRPEVPESPPPSHGTTPEAPSPGRYGGDPAPLRHKTPTSGPRHSIPESPQTRRTPPAHSPTAERLNGTVLDFPFPSRSLV